MSSTPTPLPPEPDGLPRRWKLALVELIGFGLMVAGAVLLVVNSWERGLPVLGIGALLLLAPTQVVQLVERFFPLA